MRIAGRGVGRGVERLQPLVRGIRPLAARGQACRQPLHLGKLAGGRRGHALHIAQHGRHRQVGGAILQAHRVAEQEVFAQRGAGAGSGVLQVQQHETRALPGAAPLRVADVLLAHGEVGVRALEVLQRRAAHPGGQHQLPTLEGERHYDDERDGHADDEQRGPVHPVASQFPGTRSCHRPHMRGHALPPALR